MSLTLGFSPATQPCPESLCQDQVPRFSFLHISIKTQICAVVERDSVVTKDRFEALSISSIDEEDAGSGQSRCFQLMEPFNGEGWKGCPWGWPKGAISRVISRLMYLSMIHSHKRPSSYLQ